MTVPVSRQGGHASRANVPGSGEHATQRTEGGVCPTPMTWETLQAIVADGSLASMQALGRSQETLRRYHEFKARISEFYASIEDKIMIDVFNCDWKVNEDRKIVHVPSSPGSSSGGSSGSSPPSQSSPIFVQNDFPYNLASGIEHYLLWSDRAMSNDEVEAYLHTHPIARQSSAWLTFVNPLQLQSIPDIHHVHVLLKMR